MTFGQQTGPPASTKQIAYLLSLLNADGYDFATGRHQYGLTQRQARGKFTVREASDLIDRLVAKADGAEEEIVAAPAPNRSDDQRVALLRSISAEALADELRRRGWTVTPPA